MSTQRGGRILKGAFVSVTDEGGMTVIPFQYNPEKMQRNVTPNMVGGEEQDRTMAVVYKGPPNQTINVSVEFDASEQLNLGDQNAEEYGVYAQLAALELQATPTTVELQQMQSKISLGVMEVMPLAAPTLYFVWGSARILPVRLTQYSITEELFDATLNPVHVTVAVSMRVLNTSDVDSTNQAYHHYMAYQQKMEQIAPNAYGNMKATGTNI